MSTVLIEVDWVVFGMYGKVLHHATVVNPLSFADEAQGEALTACGRSGIAFIPGLFDRMGLPRCGMCCDRVGYPRGKGSPKNDPRCRRRLDERLSGLKEQG